MWKRFPDAIIGGRPRADEVIIDPDPRHGGTLERLTEMIGEPLPATLTVYSGRGDGGCHLYFKHPGGQLRGKICTGFDIKHAGSGYTILPPSPHPDTGKPYRWSDPDAAVLDMPPALAELVQAPIVPSGGNNYTGAPTTNKLTGILRKVSEAGEGNRNDIMWWAGCRLADEDYPATAWDALAEVGRAIGLDDYETHKVLRMRPGHGRAAA
jgi:hypothetical protein